MFHMRKLPEIYMAGPSVEYYDAVYPEGFRGDLAFYLRMARATGGPILELGVGTGRIAVPLARKGYKVTGLDISPRMLAVARRKAAVLAPGLRPGFVRGDMARFSLGRKFRLIIVPFRAFQHLMTPERQRSALLCMRRHIVPGGRLVIAIFDPLLETMGPKPKVRLWHLRLARDARGNRVEVRNLNRENDPLRQILREKWEWKVRDRRGRLLQRVVTNVGMRWTYRNEMRYLLELAGFKVVACPSDFKGSPPKYGGEQIWICRPA